MVGRSVVRFLGSLLLLQGAQVGVAWACSCAQVPDEADFDVVFEGQVLGSSGGGCNREARTRLEVTQATKGTQVGDIVRVRHGIDDQSCGVRFQSGETVEIFAYEQDGALWTDGCSVR